MKKNRKPRTATGRPLNKFIEQFKWYQRIKCPYWNEPIKEGQKGFAECSYPWWKQCDGNLFNCCKLRYHHLATRKDTNKTPDFYEPA